MSGVLAALWRGLTSRRLSVATMLAWVGLLAVWIVPFEIYGLPRSQLKNIVYQEPFFQVLYVLLVVNTAACMIPRVKTVFRRTTYRPSEGSDPRVPDTALHVDGAWEADRAAAALRASGLRDVVAGEGWAWGASRRWSPWGDVVFHLSFFVIILGALLYADPSANFAGKLVIAEGESWDGSAERYVETDGEAADVPSAAFTLQTLSPEFHEDLLLFTRLDGTLATEGGLVEMSLSDPWLVDPMTMVAVEDFGYAPEVFAEQEGYSPPQPRIYRLKAFPAGTQDSFIVTGVGANNYEIDMRIYGDYVDRDGVPGTASFNLADPWVELDVFRILSTGLYKPVVEDALVAVGEPLEAGGVTVHVLDVRYYGVFRVTRSPAPPVVLAGIVLLAIGTVMRLLFPRREVLVAAGVSAGDGDGGRGGGQDDGDGGASGGPGYGGVLVSARLDAYGRAPTLARRVAERWEEAR